MTARLTACALLALSLVATPVASHADEFADFRVPTHRVLLWTGDASGSGSWRSSDDDASHRSSGFESGNLTSSLYFRREADAGVRQIVARVGTDGSRSHDAGTGRFAGTATSAGESMQQSASGSASLDLIEEWYPTALPVSVAASLHGSSQDVREWSDSREVDIYPPPNGIYRDEARARDDWRYERVFGGTLGAGVGRVRNVTGLFEALVFEKRLLASGALARPLGAAAKRELATLFYARSDYTTSMERPAATVWAAIEDILRRDGALSGPTLDARRLFEAADPFIGRRAYAAPDGLPASTVMRRRGGLARVVVTGTTHQYVHRADVRTSSIYGAGTPSLTRTYLRETRPGDAASAGIVAEYHRPAGLRWQYDASLSTLVPLKSGNHGFSEAAAAAANFIVTDRWLASASVSHERNVDRDDSGLVRRDGWSLYGNGSCEYWVTDHVDLHLSCSQGWAHDRTDGSPGYAGGPIRRQDGRFSFGLGYRFAGFTEIPGIGALAP